MQSLRHALVALTLALPTFAHADAPPAPPHPRKTPPPTVVVPGAPADASGATDWKGAAAIFKDAVEKNDPAKLLSLLPEKPATAKLFGKKVTREQAEATLKMKNGVYRLLKWPAEVDKNDPSASPLSEIQHSRTSGFAVLPSPR